MNCKKCKILMDLLKAGIKIGNTIEVQKFHCNKCGMEYERHIFFDNTGLVVADIMLDKNRWWIKGND